MWAYAVGIDDYSDDMVKDHLMANRNEDGVEQREEYTKVRVMSGLQIDSSFPLVDLLALAQCAEHGGEVVGCG